MENEKKAPFVLVFLTHLRIVKFQTKDEFKDAMLKLTNDETPFIALIYHADADVYTVPEVVT